MHETHSRDQITLLTDEVTRLWSKGCQLTSRIHPKWPFILRAIFPVRRSYTANKKKKGKSSFTYTMVSHIERSSVETYWRVDPLNLPCKCISDQCCSAVKSDNVSKSYEPNDRNMSWHWYHPLRSLDSILKQENIVHIW